MAAIMNSWEQNSRWNTAALSPRGPRNTEKASSQLQWAHR